MKAIISEVYRFRFHSLSCQIDLRYSNIPIVNAIINGTILMKVKIEGGLLRINNEMTEYANQGNIFKTFSIF